MTEDEKKLFEELRFKPFALKSNIEKALQIDLYEQSLAAETTARLLAEGRVGKLRKSLEEALISLENFSRNDALRWATMDVAQRFVETTTKKYVDVLKETSNGPT